MDAVGPQVVPSVGTIRQRFTDRRNGGGLLDRILRTGTLIIESASQDPLEFHDIPQVERVHSLLYHEVFDTLGSEESPS